MIKQIVVVALAATVAAPVWAGEKSRGGKHEGMGLGSGAVLGLKDEAKALLNETPGLQLPNDLLLYARTMSYVFGLAQELDPEADVMKLCLPPLLQFLAQRPSADEGDGSR